MMDRTVSIIVPTLGRSSVARGLLGSLAEQRHPAIEIIVVDQNDDDRMVPIVAEYRQVLPLVHHRTPGIRGISRAKNTGLRLARGNLVGFADDDCWYPPTYLEYGASQIGDQAASITGRTTDTNGRSVNGRFALSRIELTPGNVWIGGIEAVGLFRREALATIGGFDERIGIGASTRWQSTEGQDLLLRLLARGYRCVFDPDLTGVHPEIRVSHADGPMQRRARAYGRGMGFVLAKHGLGLSAALYRASRPLASAARSAITGDFGESRFHLNVALGRLEGWIDGVADRKNRERDV